APRGEAGAEDEGRQIVARRGRVRLEEAGCDALGADRLEVETAPVVAQRDVDAAVALHRSDLDHPDVRLARGAPVHERLEAVRHRVPDEVEERSVERLDERAVDLDLAPDAEQVHLLSDLARRLARRALQAPEERV